MSDNNQPVNTDTDDRPSTGRWGMLTLSVTHARGSEGWVQIGHVGPPELKLAPSGDLRLSSRPVEVQHDTGVWNILNGDDLPLAPDGSQPLLQRCQVTWGQGLSTGASGSVDGTATPSGNLVFVLQPRDSGDIEGVENGATSYLKPFAVDLTPSVVHSANDCA